MFAIFIVQETQFYSLPGGIKQTVRKLLFLGERYYVTFALCHRKYVCLSSVVCLSVVCVYSFGLALAKAKTFHLRPRTTALDKDITIIIIIITPGRW